MDKTIIQGIKEAKLLVKVALENVKASQVVLKKNIIIKKGE